LNSRDENDGIERRPDRFDCAVDTIGKIVSGQLWNAVCLRRLDGAGNGTTLSRRPRSDAGGGVSCQLKDTGACDSLMGPELKQRFRGVPAAEQGAGKRRLSQATTDN
jgi:hypothetical protein